MTWLMGAFCVVVCVCTIEMAEAASWPIDNELWHVGHQLLAGCATYSVRDMAMLAPPMASPAGAAAAAPPTACTSSDLFARLAVYSMVYRGGMKHSCRAIPAPNSRHYYSTSGP